MTGAPFLYERLAETLVAEDGVRVILGCYMSSTRKAVLPVLDRWNALLLYPTLYEGFEYARHVFYTGAAPNQNSVQLAEYMTRNFGSRVFMIGSDYVYPYESNRIMSDLVRSRLSYWLYTAAAGAFLRDSFAYDDGRLSIRKSLTKREAVRLVGGDPLLAGVEVRSVFPGHIVFLSRPRAAGHD